MRCDRLTSQDGLLGGVDALAFGTLVFLVGTLLVVNAWSVLDARMAVAAAAREAVRTVAEAPPEAFADHHALDALAQRARDRAVEVVRAHGRMVDPTDHPLEVRFDPIEPGAVRCARAVAHVTYRAQVVALPFVGVFRDGIEVRVDHGQRIDPFRSGLAGQAVGCA